MKDKLNVEQATNRKLKLDNVPDSDLSILLIELCENYLQDGDLLNIGVSNYVQKFHKRGLNIHLLDFIYETFSFLSDSDTPSLPYKSNSFNIVLAVDMLQKVKDITKIVTEIHRLLKPGAVFVFTYKKSLNSYNISNDYFSCERVINGSQVYSHYDGYIQHILIQNDFFIQHEHEYFVSNEGHFENVLIVAEKK